MGANESSNKECIKLSNYLNGKIIKNGNITLKYKVINETYNKCYECNRSYNSIYIMNCSHLICEECFINQNIDRPRCKICENK